MAGRMVLTSGALTVAMAANIFSLAPRYTAPKTPWGDPDLQGIWTSDDMRGVPRERPEEFGTRQFLTDAEYLRRAEIDQQTQRQQLRGPYGARTDLRSRSF